MNYIKSGIAVIALALIVCTAAVLHTSAENTMIGDVDGDRAVTIMDATAIQRGLAGLRVSVDAFDPVGDADADGEITIADATLIQRYEAKMISALPYGPFSPTEAPAVFPTDSEGWGQIIIRP